MPGVGERAILRRTAKTIGIFASQGSNFLMLLPVGNAPALKREQDLFTLAKETYATTSRCFRLSKYEVAERALANDKAAFEVDPKNFTVFLAGMTKFDEVRIYKIRAAAANPDDIEILYQQGVLDWHTTYQPRMLIRARLGLSSTQSLSGLECANVRNANRERMEEGLAYLAKAIRLQSDFGDAMAYLNLLYRERADCECDDTAARVARISRLRTSGLTKSWPRRKRMHGGT